MRKLIYFSPTSPKCSSSLNAAPLNPSAQFGLHFASLPLLWWFLIAQATLGKWLRPQQLWPQSQMSEVMNDLMCLRGGGGPGTALGVLRSGSGYASAMWITTVKWAARERESGSTSGRECIKRAHQAQVNKKIQLKCLQKRKEHAQYWAFPRVAPKVCTVAVLSLNVN